MGVIERNKLPEFSQRVYDEMQELHKKIDNLREFLFREDVIATMLAENKITHREVGYLKTQLSLMQDYEDILIKRIDIHVKNLK